MAQFPDIYCYIKLIDEPGGKAIPSGSNLPSPANVIVRYVVANDSHLPAGPLTVVGALTKNGVRVQPSGQPNVVPSQTITVQPNQIWKREYTVSDQASGVDVFEASLAGDVGWGDPVVEEDETNNQGYAIFRVIVQQK